MSSAEFSKVCKNLLSMDELVNIKINENYVRFNIQNENFVGGFFFEENNSDDPQLQFKIESENDVDLVFALSYLNLVAKGSYVNQKVKLSLSKGLPLLAQYDLGGLGVLKYYLAERLRKDD